MMVREEGGKTRRREKDERGVKKMKEGEKEIDAYKGRDNGKRNN